MIAAESGRPARPPTGIRFFMATIANTLNPAETKSSFNLGRIWRRSFFSAPSQLLVAHPSVPANNLQELIALARAKPESPDVALPAMHTGQAYAVRAELFNARAGTKILAVPYQGGSNQALSDLLSGRIR